MVEAPGRHESILHAEFETELPHGYIDAAGQNHRVVRMRRATARDELSPLIDRRVADNPAYFGILLLSLVITQLGTITDVHPDIVEDMVVEDVLHLQEFYQRVNSTTEGQRACRSCGAVRESPVARGRLGES
ncbi:phage tail assembly protein [Nocardia brasiliensis]|uniref:phage tail assembly protein n=1 Tax=Nocardia brasiliensis TaxID=37326 RepID=UPI002454FDA7|nr:phage tail assembly protein [Nocardia brasiliensis]